MLVTILKPFLCSDDGVTARQMDAGAFEQVRDDLVPGLVAEGYVAIYDGAIVIPGQVTADEVGGIRETKIIEAAPETGVLCRATARLDADAIGIAPGSDPIASCAQRWADGLLGDPGQPVPPLTACVSNNGSIDVFPGDATVCETLGLIAADDELTPDNAAIVALQDRLVNEINGVDCQPVQAAAAAAQEILAQSGFDGWKVAIAADAQAGTCGKAGVDSAARTVTIIEFKAP